MFAPAQVMKYLALGLLTAAFAGIEFHHELGGGDTHAGGVCMAPESQQAHIRDLLLQHQRSH